ncbi:MAG: response regulator transcription factor [Anaerolineae bacterium]|jgi:DNA-binding response OmpR family regulator|nr:response regulator transcription factor [Anaerolineae bacterium]MDX9832217.1 response regulator transcription factor [Anaerolineae bacterium]
MPEIVRTLIVDDDEKIRFVLTETLQGMGHVVETASSGEEALECLRNTHYDLSILDLRLGGRVDGLRVLEAIKWRWPNTATIILTGHGSLDSAMAAIREGIDAYMLKPVRVQEIRQTVQEALERQKRASQSLVQDESSNIVARGAFTADVMGRRVTLNGEPLELTTCEYELLVYMMHNAHRVISPQELVQVVRQYECDHLQEARDVIKWYIYRLRRKVEPNPTRPRHILNVRGVGYTFKE